MQVSDILRKQKYNYNIIKYGQQIITYSQLHLTAEKKSNYLNQTKINSNVFLFLPNGLEFLIAYFSVQYANKTVIPINISTSGPELADMVSTCNCNLIITNNINLNKIKDYISPSVTITFLDEMTINKQQSIKNDLATYPVMLNTSGTTSASKFVMLSAESLIINLKEHSTITQLKSTDIPLIILPMTSAYCHTLQMLSYIYYGIPFVIMDKFFTLTYFLSVIKRENITWIECVPLILNKINSSSKILDFCHVRHIGFGGSNIANETIKSLIYKYPDIVFTQGYGQTEASPLITQVEPNKYRDKIGSVGKPIPSIKAKILSSDNTCGELVVSGKCIMNGYYNNDSETKRVLKNGYLHTGDIACIDDDGYVYIQGRLNNLIITGGSNVYPEEIENILIANLEIKDVHVYGEKDDIFGEIVAAQIVLKEISYTSKEIAIQCKKYLADYKVPRKFYFVDAIPKTTTGKNYRKTSTT